MLEGFIGSNIPSCPSGRGVLGNDVINLPPCCCIVMGMSSKEEFNLYWSLAVAQQKYNDLESFNVGHVRSCPCGYKYQAVWDMGTHLWCLRIKQFIGCLQFHMPISFRTYPRLSLTSEASIYTLNRPENRRMLHQSLHLELCSSIEAGTYDPCHDQVPMTFDKQKNFGKWEAAIVSNTSGLPIPKLLIFDTWVFR